MKSTKLKGIGIIVIALLILQVFMPIFVYAADNIATTKYRIINGYITKIIEGETVATLLENVSSNTGEEIAVYDGNTEAEDTTEIRTGMTLKTGTTVYTLVVLGDINADGKNTATDLSILKKAVVNLIELKDATFEAADMNGDGKLTALDLSRLKMRIVGLELPDEFNVNVNGEITITPSTTAPARTLEVTVEWPADIEGLTKQISVDGGKTFTSNINKATVTDNGIVIARLLDSTSKVVKSATLEITNIDNIAPAEFTPTVTHTIANYLTLKGETTDAEVYHFSKNNGSTWLPNEGLASGEYTFTEVEPNTTLSLRMKATDAVGNERITDPVTQRTFKSGIDILAERMPGLTIDKEEETLALPDGRVYKLSVTVDGSYRIQSVGTSLEAAQIATEEAMLNTAIEEFEQDGIKTIDEILEYVVSEDLGDVISEEKIISIESSKYYNMYRIITNSDGTHTVTFVEQILKNGLTSSGQVQEQETIDKIEALIAEMAEESNTSIIDLLQRAIDDGILLDENVNKNTGRFETENGNVYQAMIHEDKLIVELIGSAEEVAEGIISDRFLQELESGIKEAIIDWAIADGITTEELANRTDGEYETTTGEYKRIYVDLETGLYETITVPEPEGAKITYTLDPDFPTMTNTTTLTITATDEAGVAKIEIISEIGEILLTESFEENNTTVNLEFEITQNATYTVRAITTDGKESEKQILISHISTLLPIKVTISPESARNTEENSTQNGIVTGPITVTLQYSEALGLPNVDKYQYQVNSTTGEWATASKDQMIENITENTKIYARYWDGENSLKQITVVIDNVDNVDPNAFEFTAITTSHSITVTPETEDTAADSAGNPAREGIGQILRYEYSLDGQNWQENSIISGLTQNTDYTVYVKSIDYAGNETMATNNGTVVKTAIVPKASDVVTFEYSTTELTNEAVTVTIKTTGLTDETNEVEYQILERGKTEADLGTEWEKGNVFDVTDNCTIFARIVDVTGQENPDKGYANGEVANIDNLAPQKFTPKVTARTQTSITVNASSSNSGMAADAVETPGSLSSGVASYTYYLIPTAGNVVKVSDVTSHNYTFANLKAGRAYSIYVEAKDNAGNIRVSEQITTGTNAKPGEITEVTTTVNGLLEDATYNNPVVPAGFKPVNTEEANWGDDTTLPTGWNDGLVLEDKKGNQFVWTPVDGTDVKYEKWTPTGTSHSETTDGENPVVETEQIEKYKGFYIARYEAGKSSADILSKAGETAQTSIRYAIAKEKAEAMYETVSVQSGLVTGTQWDTLMRWIANDENNSYVTTNTEWGNYTGTKESTGANEEWVAKNIYDLAGNVQEITNELAGSDVIVRGGAFDREKAAGDRSKQGKELTADRTGFRVVLYVVEREIYEPEGDGKLGIGNYNEGPGNQTINGLPASYNNPVVPVGFRAVNTDDASWAGVTPSGWNQGLVIEDVNGNQYVWIPVDGTTVKYEKGTLVWQSDTDHNVEIAGDEIPATVTELDETEATQIEDYQGFYIARYEAGNEEGNLASKAGLKVINALDYATAKQYAESMYNTPYVKSGLPTGTSWDTMTTWLESQYGTTFVQANTKTGNSYYNTFTFNGDYAIGPNSPTEVRGDYITPDEEVTKPAKTSYLLATGLLEDMKMNNLYDLAGNVWEYTTEYYTTLDGNVYIARGSDYYRKEARTWGVAIREGITTPPGEERNEGGFRVMLYLSEGTADVGVYEDYNRTMNGKPSTYDNPIIPAGFAAVNEGANWGNGADVAPEWNDGLVIKDVAGNQFVWVPVDGTNVTYEKWTTRGISYKETDGDITPEALTEWSEDEKTQVLKYGGFYVSRYEISQGTEQEAKSVAEATPWINITWEQAKEKAEGMIVHNTVATGLVTGTQWDTVLRWIGNEKGETAVVDDSTSWGNYANSDLGRNAKAKNIYEMAGGSWEWTAEYQGDGKIFRGGVSTDSGASSPAAYRDAYTSGAIDEATTFRTVLYVTGEVLGIAKKPVQEGEKLNGTEFPAAVNAPELAEGMTPVKWSGSTWVETTADDPEWYNYSDISVNGANTSKWANAMMPDGTLFVWVPRYAYKISYEDYTTTSRTNYTGRINGDPIINKTSKVVDSYYEDGDKVNVYEYTYTLRKPIMNVVFLSGNTDKPQRDVRVYAEISDNVTTQTDYITHPAFRNNTKIGGWDRELEGIWVAKYERGASHDQQGGTQYAAARSAMLGLTEEQKEKIDTHMAKNTEWGAAAYLAFSNYGSGSATASSTTGNAYGIYQMAGGNLEYTAAYLSRILPARTSNIYAIRTAPEKYKQVYGSYYGDAYGETAWWKGSACYSPGSYMWDHGSPRPLFVRGVAMTSGANSIFATSVQCSNTNYAYSYRMILIPNA